MIKLHRLHSDGSDNICNMNGWCDSMNSLESGVLHLLTIYASIQQQSQQFRSSINSEKIQFDTLEKENNIRNEAHLQLAANVSALSTQLTSVDAQIRNLVMQRQQIQQQLNATKQTMNT
eukprot:UN11365